MSAEKISGGEKDRIKILDMVAGFDERLERLETFLQTKPSKYKVEPLSRAPKGSTVEDKVQRSIDKMREMKENGILRTFENLKLYKFNLGSEVRAGVKRHRDYDEVK